MNSECYIWGLNANITMQNFQWTLWKLGLLERSLPSDRKQLYRVSETWFPYTRRTCTCSIHAGIHSDDAQKVGQNDN